MKYAEKMMILNAIMAMEELADEVTQAAFQNPYETGTGQAIAYRRVYDFIREIPVEDPREENRHENNDQVVQRDGLI